MKFITLFLRLALLNLFAYFTIKLRPILFKVNIFKPMLKNFKLSILPLIILLLDLFIFVLLSYLGTYFGISFLRILAYTTFFIGLLVWLLFLPNSGYLITELNMTHRNDDKKEVPIWYDIASVFSFALSGIVNTLANIIIIQLVFLVFLDPIGLTSLDYTLLFLSGLIIILLIVIGIYLGRTIRFNSWDILHPLSFFKKLKTHFTKVGNFKDFVLYITINTIFFLIMYIMFGIPFYFMK